MNTIWGRQIFLPRSSVGPSDEEGRGLPHAFMEAREGRMARRAGGQDPGEDRARTVKGAVHDIGKNIVGVVLAATTTKWIDMG